MTDNQATEIREYLIEQLNKNGYSDIVREINTRLQEDFEEKDFHRTPRQLLNFFLSESIDILSSLSNNYEELISRFNKINSNDKNISGISVELLNQGETTFFDLKNLPNYTEITIAFEEVQSIIENSK
jgi:hypothetical protein